MSHPFDEFSKSLSEESVPRRESLRWLGAVFAGAVLGPLGLGTASADPQPRRYRAPVHKIRRAPDPCEAFCRCRNAKQQSKCLAACRACNGNTNRLAGSCGSYTCCSTASCNGVCSDLKSDPNCGACGNNCGASGQSCCGNRCADLKSDVSNCGTCGRVCSAGTTCVNGTCVGNTPTCPSGQTICGASCVDLLSDNGNCGSCGNACVSGSNCTSGTCTSTIVCPPGFVWCGLYCANLDWDASNCGSCGFVCPSNSGCAFGVCGSTGGGE